MSEEMTGEAGGFAVGVAPGRQIAGYRLEQEIGQGGMAMVFRARDERLGRQVALKILAPGLAADEGFRQRFIRESRSAAAVDDPHIIPVFEAGESDGMLFIAMRYVPGGDARSLVRQEGPLPPGRVAAVISPVASALDAAHAAGLLHRDVKPANMLVDAVPGRPDHVYLSDFGLSKAAVSSSAGLTGMGQFLGTLDYVSPEQIAGQPVDGRADEYALACSAFELLTGAPPFRRDEAMAVMYAQLSEPPPSLSSRRPGAPAAADGVLAKALAKDPANRYPSCRDFAEALRGAFGLPPYHTAPAARPAAERSATEVADLPTGEASVPVPSTADTSPVRPSGLGRDGGPARAPRRVRPRHAAAIAAVVAVLAVAGVIAALLTGGGGSAPVVSAITAKSAFAPETGDVYVVYRGGSQASARLSGEIHGAASGEVAQVYAQPFPFRRAPAPVGSPVILHPVGAAVRYGFKVTPTLATRYRVEVFQSSTATRPVSVSAPATVYVTTVGVGGNGRVCARPVCRETLPMHVFVPASALATELAKRWYPYFNLSLAPSKEPTSPKVLLLGAGDPHVTASRRVSATEFELSITFTFRIGNDAYYWNWNTCSADTEAADGIGLPGHHGCGSKSVLASAAYLG
jgi:Protein kinase domain